MWKCKLWFVFLLWLTFCSYNRGDREHLDKTIGKKDDFTPVCSNSTQNPIAFVVCKIRPVRSREEECHLIYRLTKGFEAGCDSRFSLMLRNNTMFLHLNNLTVENSGNHTCECSGPGGTFTLQLNITVEDDEDPVVFEENTFPTIPVASSGVLLLIFILLGVISGWICRNKCHRRKRTNQPNTVIYEVPDIEPYSVFRENELYLTSYHIHTSSTYNLIMAGMDNLSTRTPV